jgi:hypothetical protein
VLGRVNRDLDPAARPVAPARAHDRAVRQHQAAVPCLGDIHAALTITCGDVDVGHPGPALHGVIEVGLHEQQIVVLVRDDRQIGPRGERLAIQEPVVAARGGAYHDHHQEPHAHQPFMPGCDSRHK